ncbi:hypothetical protein [Pedobacter aquatilis]|uniref:hypothetical protein n=1 Tax=Pedobacter aquatilis TaxID=351343 RepID=UPI002930307F|nr:hypothetical protein [Pedobacter aquatilis]
MKKLTLITFLLSLFFTLQTFGQIRDDKSLNDIISNNITDTYKKPVSQKVVLFSVYLYISEKGQLDSISYSDVIGEVPLALVINKKRLNDHLKKSNQLFSNSKNSVIILPYMIWYLDDISAKYINELLSDFMNLFPSAENVGKRKIILNKPHSIAIAEPEY